MILLPGNMPVPMNYPSNTLRFRQDSNFLYYCGLDYPNLTTVIDATNGETTLFGDDLEVDDIVWEGERITVKKMAESAGIDHIEKNYLLPKFLSKVNIVHTLPAYRDDQKSFLRSILDSQNFSSSKELIVNVIKQRSIKSKEEIYEIERALSLIHI